MNKRTVVLSGVLVSLLSGLAAALPGQSLPPGLDDHVLAVMDRFEVPGLALAIVKDGELVLARGYGVRRLGAPGPVTPGTLFAIASNTKAFTATALGLLVEEGKMEWDAPVIDYLPWFQMYDPWVTREITVRDLLVHRSGLGLGAGDLLWWPPTDYDRTEIVRRLRYIEPATSFRSAYAYDNVLYAVAAEVIEAVTGQRWEAFASQRILRPLGMRGSRVRLNATAEDGDVAAPHNVIDGRVRPVEPFVTDNVNPAGGILSSAADMARWMIVQLDSGRVALPGIEPGTRIFSPATTRELWTPVTPIPIRNPPRELPLLRRNFQGYALGFNVRDYRGTRVVTHTGGLPGYLSRVTLVPEAKLGVAVLTNMMEGEAFEAVTYSILDHYLEEDPFDWLAAYDALDVRLDERLARLEERTAASTGSSWSPFRQPWTSASTSRTWS